jgi:RND superfamily putative drug exporter
MATITTRPHRPAHAHRHARPFGPLGRLGHRAARHRGRVFAAWLLIVLGLGFFAPRVESALAGAGWEDSGSESVHVRQTVQKEFAGLSSAALQVVVSVDSGSVATGVGRP